MDVHLLVYDLSGGMAKQLSMSFLGFQLDAIYHTSIELNGLEYVYDGGINLIQPGSSHLGQPLERIHLGQTDLPMDVIGEYVDSLRQVFTPQAYDLFRHNCNNFSNDFAAFLVGKGIPDHIANMPQAVLDSPFGRMLQPQLEQMVQNRKAQQGGLLGIQSNSTGAQGNGQTPSSAQGIPAKTSPSVRNIGSLSDLNTVLEAAANSCTIVFFTSATCPPCKALYPLYDELAAEWGDKVTLVKVDISRAFDVGQRYSIRGTPTFITFVHGKEEERWSGADASRLRGTVSLLAHMAHPSHPHESLNLPHFANPDPKPVLYAKIPPLPKLLSKLGTATAEAPAIQGVKAFIEARTTEGPAQAHLPDMPGFSAYIRSAVRDLPTDILFPLVDLFRCALVDPRFSGYFAEEGVGAAASSTEATATAISTVLSTVNSLHQGEVNKCPYPLRLVTLQMCCNLFSSPLAADRILAADEGAAEHLRTPIVQLISTSFLDSSHANIRVAAASLLYNLASAHSVRRRRRPSSSSSSAAATALPEADQVELAASLLEAIGQEEESPEALRGMLLALGYLVYCLPSQEEEEELVDLLSVLDAKGTVSGKKDKFKGEEEVALIREVGEELLGRGFSRR